MGLSKMNFFGIGAKMMNGLMKKKGVKTLPELIELARELGVRMVACTMSMDVMGITEEEVIDGIELDGVASYLSEADEANVNLFIA